MHCAILHRLSSMNSQPTTEIESNQKTNFLAFGDITGLLQIVDLSKTDNKNEAYPISRDESMIQGKKTTFQGLSFHKLPINRLQWNPNFEKIATVDDGNSLVVWNKGENDIYSSQMVNNRGVSTIVDVRWSKSGRDISFLYEDGHIYSGTVEGKNTWFNNLEEETRFIEYSPNDDKILVSKKREKIFVLSSSGRQVGEITLSESIKNMEIIDINWWGGNDNYYDSDNFQRKHLMIAFKNGTVILIDDETDEDPVVIKTELKKITKTQWEADGLCIAILGELVDDETIKEEEKEDEKETEKGNNNIENEKENHNDKNNNVNENNDKENENNGSDNDNYKENEINTNVNKNGEEANENPDNGNVNINNDVNIYSSSVNNHMSIYNSNMNNIYSSTMNNKNIIRSIVLFYNIKGELIKRFVCPCHVNSFSWGYTSTLALAAEKYIYLAFVKYRYKWTYFNDTIVFAYLLSDNKYNIIYLDTINNTKQCKLVYNLINVISYDYFCLIILEKDEDQYSFMITNSFCNVLDTKLCPIKPIYYCMNSQFITISDNDYVYVLQFRGKVRPKNEGNNLDKNSKHSDLSSSHVSRYNNVSINRLNPKSMNEFCFFIDDELRPEINYDFATFQHNQKAKNPINNIYLSSIYLYVSKSNGIINKYNLYLMTMEKKFKIDENLKYFGLSPFEQYLWCINMNDYLSIYSLEKENPEKLNYSQKEVWDIKWCIKKDEDEVNEDTLEFAVLQKNRLYFINNLEIEGEMQKCSDYLGKYLDNEVTAVRIEKLNNDRNNDFFEGKDYLKKYENKVLREFNEILEDDEKGDLKEAFDFATKHPCNSFFTSITKKALDKLDLDTAQKTMLQTGDFEGLEFLKKIKGIDDEEMQKAEILEYNSNYDEASKTYNKMNRGDLDLAMNMKLGKWDKVTDIMSKDNPNTKDENLKKAYNQYADELMEKKEYDKAEENYQKSGNIQGLTNVYFAKEDYNKAAEMLEVIPEEDEFLEEVGDKFKKMGMCEEAAKAFIKHGNVNKAMEAYMENNKWEEAIELSRQNDFMNMEQLTNKFSSEFIKSGRKLDLVELYSKANMKNKANKYLKEIACDMRKIRQNPLLIKKIYVLAALELEIYKSQITDSQINDDEHIHDNYPEELKNKNPEKKIVKNNYSSKEIDRIIFNQWRGAEAFHFYMLCQVQLYKKKFKEACKTAMRLTLYEKELGTEEVYRLIALCSYLNKCFKICSRALNVLENLQTINIQRRAKYKELAKSIFLKYGPKNIDEKYLKCPNEQCKQLVSEYDIYCKNCGHNFSGCVLSGASIFDHHYFKCKQCHHKTKKSEVKRNPINNCPLCHVSLREKK